MRVRALIYARARTHLCARALGCLCAHHGRVPSPPQCPNITSAGPPSILSLSLPSNIPSGMTRTAPLSCEAGPARSRSGARGGGRRGRRCCSEGPMRAGSKSLELLAGPSRSTTSEIHLTTPSLCHFIVCHVIIFRFTVLPLDRLSAGPLACLTA